MKFLNHMNSKHLYSDVKLGFCSFIKKYSRANKSIKTQRVKEYEKMNDFIKGRKQYININIIQKITIYIFKVSISREFNMREVVE